MGNKFKSYDDYESISYIDVLNDLQAKYLTNEDEDSVNVLKHWLEKRENDENNIPNEEEVNCNVSSNNCHIDDDNIDLGDSLDIFFGQDDFFKSEESKKRFNNLVCGVKNFDEYKTFDDDFNFDYNRKESFVSRIKKRFKRKEKKELNFEEIESPKKKKSLKKKVIAVTSTIVAGIVAFSTFAFNSCGKKEDKIDPTTVKVITPIDDIPNNFIVQKEKVKKQTMKKSTSGVKKSVIKYKLRNKVILKKGSLIYTSAYDSVHNTNGMTPYYSYGDCNSIVGVTLSLNNNIATLVSVDNNTYEFRVNNKVEYLTYQESLKVIKSMTKKGWKQTGVALLNDKAKTGVTGFYKINAIAKQYHR